MVLVSGAYQPIVEAFSQRLGFAVAIGSSLIYTNGTLANLELPINSYTQKAQNIRSLYPDTSILAAYGDTVSDLPMLELSERPTAVEPDTALRSIAENRNWTILECHNRESP